jgi:alginate O-acetyltransferase complex protein AlgJ
MPDASDVIINPYGRKFLKDCQEAGIEVIDVLPHLLEAKAKDEESEEHLYQHQDTHWTNRGLQIAAGLIAERVKEYAWYDELSDRKVDYSVADTTFMRQGDIVDKLPEDIRANYPAVELEAQRVMTPEGKPYRGRGKTTAPIMLAGDSFTGVFELVDCKSAGVGSHLAAKTGLPVDIVTSWGGGPLVRQKAYNYNKRSQTMKHKRLVVYLMVARDLYDYSQSWKPLEKK